MNIMTNAYRPLLNILGGLLFLFSSFSTRSQSLQLVGFSFTRFPGAVVKDTPLNQKVEVNEYNFFVNLPKQLKNEKTTLINGLQYRLVTPLVDNDLNLGLDGRNLHLVGYRLSVLQQLTNDWKVLLSLNPTLSSSFNTQLAGEDFLMNGALLFVKKKSERFSYGGGIAYLSSFGEPAFIPTLQLTLSSEKSKLQMLLPRRIVYDHYFGKWTAGLKIEANGSRYNVDYNRTNTRNDTELVDMLAYAHVVFGPSLKYRLGKAIQLEASGGIAVARRIELQGDLIEDANYDAENGSFFQLGIAVVPPKNDKN